VSLDTALDDCNAAVAGQSRNVVFLETRGFLLLRLAQYDKAIADYDAALRIAPFQPMALYGRGVCERREGKAQQADADIRAATALSYRVADEFGHYGVQP
jgi:tetratricopeptide (TPR) repeat protein